MRNEWDWKGSSQGWGQNGELRFSQLCVNRQREIPCLFLRDNFVKPKMSGHWDILGRKISAKERQEEAYHRASLFNLFNCRHRHT